MDNNLWFWLIATLLCIFIEGFFAMGEIAIISFNKVRLQYYLNKNDKRALWIYKLLKKPAMLFGTVLLGVNIALQIGSECSRQFYAEAGLDPDWAPVTQFFLVVIIAELAPIFAGRRYAEHVAMIQSPFIYAASKILFPFVLFFSFCLKLINKLFHNTEEEHGGALSREDLQKIIEEHDDHISMAGEEEEFNKVVSNLFLLRSKTVKEVMININELKMVPAHITVLEFRRFLKKTNHSRIPVYQSVKNNIIGIAQVRDFVNAGEDYKIKNHIRSPWFITEEAKIIHILDQFRQNKQEMAICLDAKGKSVGMLTLEDILDEIFHKDDIKKSVSVRTFIEKQFDAEMSVGQFNQEYDFNLEAKSDETLEELVLKHLEHHPEVGDAVRIANLEFTVEETSFLGIKKLSIKTII